jgi:hypothetical protein
MIQYPSNVSRTLDPTKRALTHVTGLHDKRLSDADINLLQDIQDLKRKRQLDSQVSSGVLTYAPFVYSTNKSGRFYIPAFDAMINGEVVTVAGNLTADLTTNLVRLPAPSFWTSGSSQPAARIYVVFLEAWYQRLDPVSGTGFYVDSSTRVRYLSINGCVNPVQANLLPDDSTDPFMGQATTERVQLQWGIRVQPVALSYDFSTYDFGLDQGALATEMVFGQAGQSTPSSTAPYAFTKMAAINGDSGLWRAGDGNVQNELATMDGYSYAIPLAVVFQRNTGVFTVDQNPFGCADASVSNSGLLSSGVSGRYDGKYADVVYADEVVDTRSVVSLTDFKDQKVLRQGFVDLITGQTQLKIARGETPGSPTTAVGSLLPYHISVNPTAVPNADTLGSFDGFMNGFSSQAVTFRTTKAVTVDTKRIGTIGGRWSLNDTFSLSLPTGSKATISSVQVQALVDDSVKGTKTPVLLLKGQINVVGLNTPIVTVSFSKSLLGTSYDPGINPLYVTMEVTYPASGGMDLRKVPSKVSGGVLFDAASGLTLPVYGVSEYDVSVPLPVYTNGNNPALSAIAYNPEYSNSIFGTRVVIEVSGSTGSTTVQNDGSTVTTFTIGRSALNRNLTGMYVLAAEDKDTGASYVISSRSIAATQTTVAIAGNVASAATLRFTILVTNTAQLAFNAPVKGIVAIEETLLAGNTSMFRMDSRIRVVSVKLTENISNTVVLVASDGIMTGISGDDVNKYIWVRNDSDSFDEVQISNAVFSNGFITLTVPSSVNLETHEFFVVGSFRPTLSSTSTLLLTEYYVPYQGEGRSSRDYEIIHTESVALVTTNGTGAAPVPGLRDVYPYNRELPIITALPSQVAWTDAGLTNNPVAALVDTNYASKRFSNVEHTIEVPVHTNDFIEPIHGDKRKTIQLTVAGGGRGFAKAIPHIGFAITQVAATKVLGDHVTTTSGSLAVYVNNLTGDDKNDGLTKATAKKTVAGALSVLPSVLRHPCSIQLMETGSAYSISDNQPTLEVMALGDGDVRALKYYALGNLAFTIQDSGRLVVTRESGATGLITIDATGFSGFGDGPTSAFFVDNSRVLFNGIEFRGFRDPAIKAIDADVEFVNCQFTNNIVAGSFEQGSSIVATDSLIVLGDGSIGMILSQSDMVTSGTGFQVTAGATPGVFFAVQRGSSLTLQTHTTAGETNVTSGTTIAQAQLNSSVTCENDFTTAGKLILAANSVLSRTVAVNPFIGGVSADDSSTVTTSL